jgi:hypothetical protein
MKKLLTVFFLATLFGGTAYANEHGDATVEGDVVVEGEHHDSDKHEDHADDKHDDHHEEEHHE